MFSILDSHGLLDSFGIGTTGLVFSVGVHLGFISPTSCLSFNSSFSTGQNNVMSEMSVPG